MKIGGILAVCATLAIAFGMSTRAHAGTLPDITGTWYANGNRSAACRVSQSGSSVSLTNEQGKTATGRFVDPGRLSTDWGLMNGGQITGTISSDLRRISWSNGTYWSRPSAAPLAPAATPAPTPRPTPSPERLRVSVRVSNNNFSPIYVHAASLTNGYGFTYAQCLSFRNVTTKVVTAVDFAFVVTNRTGGVKADYGWTDKGTFTPPVNIDNHCFGGRLWTPPVVRAMANESVRVTQVVFADGTFWQPNKPFLRGYAATGVPLAQPTLENPSNGASNDESVAPPHPASLLGLSLEDRTSGIYVKFVAPGSAAAAAGIRQGDRIVSVASNKVGSVADVRAILEMTPTGTTIPMSLDRDGLAVSVSIKPLDAAPPSAGP
jgi:hypothetical protein